ncbi:transcription factor TGA2.2 isoform X1 [Cryptomeria japonica]|uniref:transcription factor TGA2.2 isoform X1 n=1 Tax=Cryptomeria japonica TaxID=3369 RepID=UPI0025ACF0F6|nr:transcription factor TGA2.2 isoform X1 [Cryptomeria japonica]XP_057824033.1 transcription factor TGA2.2 isoform X1 [Cryptomeria japonica]
MDSQSAQYPTSRRTGGSFDSPSTRQLDMWGDSFRAENSPRTGTSTSMEADVKIDSKSEDAQRGAIVVSRSSDQEANKPNDKVLRRLAQNREAARKSRLRKKAYVQQLETSRVKLNQLEQELERARQQRQGIYIGGNSGDHSNSTINGAANTGAAAFDMEYSHWVEEQNRQLCELRTALQAHVTDIELRILVEGSMAHYEELFRMKSVAAKADVFHLVSGMWKTPAERCFMWMGGVRPSEILNILTPQLEPLTEQQVLSVCNLRQSSQQAEDALSQGMEALQQALADTLAGGSLGTPNVANYMGQMAMAMGKLETLESFVHQADNLRQQTLQQMYRILTTRQAARGLLAMGDYFNRLRALSSLWAARPREPA